MGLFTLLGLASGRSGSLLDGLLIDRALSPQKPRAVVDERALAAQALREAHEDLEEEELERERLRARQARPLVIPKLVSYPSSSGGRNIM